MSAQRQHHVFGPVPSRRLGRSLGVDLVPFKTCSYDCIYCQLGHTTCKTVERKEWVPTDAVLAELRQKLERRPDIITLSGSGEPTLHSCLGEIIGHIRTMTNLPVAVLTNGSLLWRDDVRREVALADLVLPSLDAPDPERFEFVNRPHPDLQFDRVVEGLAALRRAFSGKYWLEVMLLEGCTASTAQVRQFADLVRQIGPDEVQLNTAVRPPAEDYAVAVAPARLEELAAMFDPPARTIADYRGRKIQTETGTSAEELLALLRRRPCTVEGIARGLGVRAGEVVKQLGGLEASGLVGHDRRGAELFYLALPVHPARTPQ